MTEDERFMDLALVESRAAEAAGDTAVACVIVRAGAVVAIGRAQVQSSGNPLAHAEMVAIDAARRVLGSADLAGTTIYIAYEPCPMCAWAIRLAGIGRIVLGARHADVGRPDLGTFTLEALASLTGQTLDLTTGVRHAECVALRQAWKARTGRLL
ncbi:MAG: nucleoside deaminase [Alphaproteobacteria bacterium]|nr:nucleoside deaminase [Alphaproteobacteria bacterium]